MATKRSDDRMTFDPTARKCQNILKSSEKSLWILTNASKFCGEGFLSVGAETMCNIAKKVYSLSVIGNTMNCPSLEDNVFSAPLNLD